MQPISYFCVVPSSSKRTPFTVTINSSRRHSVARPNPFTLHAVVDICSGYDVVRKELLPPGWLGRVIHDALLANLWDANGNSLPVRHIV